MTGNPRTRDEWVPSACTLPTVEQPLRSREFDELFRRDVLAVVRESPTSTRLDLRPASAAAGRAAELSVRETGCCAFFTFSLSIGDGSVTLRIGTSPAHDGVLAALTERARSQVGAGA